MTTHGNFNFYADRISIIECDVMELFIQESEIHGYGCFAAQPFRSNEVISSTVLVFSNKHIESIVGYTFPWNPCSLESSIVLSELSYCNSSQNPNLKIVEIDKERKLKFFEFLRDVEVGEEITLKYGKFK